MKYRIMSPGPTQVRENVRLARAMECTNPDMDVEFVGFYNDTCSLLKKAVNTDSTAVIMAGEGIMGLEAACASLTEPEDRVLVIDNGVFGKGFADFVSLYGGQPVLFSCDYHRPVDLKALKNFLEKDSEFKYATMVHCDTPTGVLNPVEEISRLLDEYGIMSVVDTVAGLFGEPLDMGSSCIDILCGGSQKALSAPPGLTMVWISDRAFKAMEERSHPITGFYMNLLNYRDGFPYTMPISDIKGLRRALDNYFEDADVLDRHRRIAEAVRQAVTAAGLTLYIEEGWSNTVTAVCTPDGLTSTEILETMCRDYGIMISTGLGSVKEQVFRLGHMGENCRRDDVGQMLGAVQGTLESLGVNLICNMEDQFRRTVN